MTAIWRGTREPDKADKLIAYLRSPEAPYREISPLNGPLEFLEYATGDIYRVTTEGELFNYTEGNGLPVGACCRSPSNSSQVRSPNGLPDR